MGTLVSGYVGLVLSTSVSLIKDELIGFAVFGIVLCTLWHCELLSMFTPRIR